MFHFPGCPPHELWIHSWVTAHYHSRVPPFGNSRINAYLQLPSTYRSLSRPSSAISALASTLRSYSLDLASSPTATFLRLLRSNCGFLLICVLSLSPSLLTGIFRELLSDFFAEISFFSCAVFKVRRTESGFNCCRRSSLRRIGFNSLPSALAQRRNWFEVSSGSLLANPQNDTDKRFSQTPWRRSRFASAIYIGLTVFRPAVFTGLICFSSELFAFNS